VAAVDLTAEGKYDQIAYDPAKSLRVPIADAIAQYRAVDLTVLGKICLHH